MACVEISGFEPELAEPKSVVLPLHHISIRSANLFHFLQFCNINHFAICHLSIKTTPSALRGDFTTVFRRRSRKSVPSSHRLAHLRELWSWGGEGKGRRAYSHVSGLLIRFFVTCWIWPFLGDLRDFLRLGGTSYHLIRESVLKRRKSKNNSFCTKF